jgi:acyl carrier protein
MTVDAVIRKVEQILVADFELEAGDVVPTASLQDDLDMDSLDGLDLIASLEKEFGIRVDDEAILELKTVGDIHSYVHEVYKRQVSVAMEADA